MKLAFRRPAIPAVVGVIMSNIASPLTSIVIAPLLARNLSLAGRGRYAALTSLIYSLPYLFSFGLQDASTYFVARSGGATKALRRASANFGIIGTLLWVPIATLLYIFLYRPAGAGLVEYILVAAAVLYSVFLYGPRGEALGLQKYGSVNAEKYIASIVRLFILVGLAITGGLTSRAAVLTAVVLTPISAVVFTRSYVRRKPIESTEPTVAEVSKYGRQVWAGSLSGAVLLRIDQVILIALIGPRQLAFYAIAVAVAELPVLLSSSMRTVYLPRIAANFDLAAYQVIARSVLAVAVGVVLLGEVVVGWLVPLVFGQRYSGAVTSLRILLPGTIALIVMDLVGTAVTAKGRPRQQAEAIFVGAVVTILTLPELAALFGAVGASVASTSSYICTAGWLIYRSAPHTGGVTDWLLPRPSDVGRLIATRRAVTGSSGGATP